MFANFRSIPAALLTVAAAALLVVSGCKSSGNHDQDAASSMSSTSQAAVYCDKCQTTFARVPVTGGSTHHPGGITGYRTVATHECAECRNVAVGVITQGKTTKPGEIVHKCKLCGGSMTVCHQS